jgi:hypothetical protein
MLDARRDWTGRLVFLGLAAVTLLNGGCLAAAVVGAAGGGAAALYSYQRGQLYREYPADLNATAAAVRVSLSELKLPPAVEKSDGGTVTFETKIPEGKKVHITAEAVTGRIPADGAVSRVTVRVGTLGDDANSARVLDQVSIHLIVPSAPPPASPPAPTPVVIQPPTPRPVETTAPPLAVTPAAAAK